MKKLVVLMVLMAVSIGTFAQKVVLRDGIYFEEKGTPFTGVLTTLYANGQKKSEVTIVNGKEDGSALYFAEDGTVLEKGNFSNGMRNGNWTRFSPAGVIIGIASFTNGKKDGTWVVNNEKGAKLFEMTYRNGEKVGVWTTWNDEGQVVATKDYGNM